MKATKATHWYFKPSKLWDTVKPYWFNLPTSALPDPSKVTNEESVPVHDIVIRDIRQAGKDSPFRLDIHGFQVERHDFSADEDESFWAEDFVHSIYRRAMEDWITELLGAESVIYLSGSIRRRDAKFPLKPYGTGKDNQPVRGVHVDYTPISARRRFEGKLGDSEAARLSNRRYQILNIWRPLIGPVRDWPLGLIDFTSLASTDLIASDVIYPHFVAETFNVFHNPHHRWYYVTDQMPNEVLIFKSFDSKAGVASVCPHASFDLGIDGERPRESVETIVMVVYPEGC